MIKIILIVLIMIGGLGVMGHYFPQVVGAQLITLGGFTITGWLVVASILLYAGIKTVH